MVRRAVVVLAWTAWWLGCGVDETPAGSAACVEAQSAECACEDGSLGVKTCSDGEYEACMCRPGSGSSAGSGGGEDGSGTGSGGASAGGGAAGSEAGGAAGDGGGAAGSGEAGGSGGSASAGSGVAGGSATGDGGSGDAGSGSGAGGAEAPTPGTPYGPCTAEGSCEDGLVCFTPSVDGAIGGYCAPTCTGNGSGLGVCEQPTSGKVHAQCAPLLSTCQLAGCENADCPTGMDCVESAAPFGQGTATFDCGYPAE